MKFTHITFIVLFIILTSCNTSKKTNKDTAKKVEETMMKNETSYFQEKAPFQISKATFQNWYGGVPGARGINVEIHGSNLKKDISFDSLYFNNKSGKIYTTLKENRIFLKANINTGNRKNSLRNYHNDEQVKPTTSKYPNLKENEAVISFIENNSPKIYKLVLVKEKDLYYQ